MHDTKPTFDSWAILEIMGHQTFAGRVSEQTIGGASFVRIDVPAVDNLQAFTKMFGASSIYCITPVTEEVAVARAKTLLQQPMAFYDLPDEIRNAVRKVRELEAIGAPDRGKDDPGYVGDDASDYEYGDDIEDN
jgi:hypothetical protein